MYNKSDLRDADMNITNIPGSDKFYISAKTGYGVDDLLDELQDIFRKGNRIVEKIIPFSDGQIINRLHEEAEVESESYEEDGVHIKALCPEYLADYIEDRYGAEAE